MLPARHRLTERADFSATVRGSDARRRGSRLLVVHARVTGRTDPSGDAPARVGLVVSRAVGGSVVRNRVARRLRHQVAPLLERLPAGTDVVLRATPAAATATSAELGEAIARGLGHQYTGGGS